MKKETIRSIVCIFALLSAIMVMVTPAAAWWDSDWQHKRPITINTTSNLINYQVNVSITYDSDMQPDFDDVRFTNEEEDTELDYWIESKSDGEWCNVWVKVDSIDTNNGTQAYMYYCNPFAASASNVTNIFLLYDDFLGTSLDTGKWETHISKKGGVSVSDGKVVFFSNSRNSEAWIQSTQIFKYPAIVEVKFLDTTASAGLGENMSSGEKYLARNNKTRKHGGYTVWNLTIIGENTSSSWVVAQKLQSDLNHSISNAVWSFVWAEGKQVVNINNCKELEGSDTNNTIGDHYIYFGNVPPYSSYGHGYTTADWVRVRKYADPEPGVSVGGEEAINIVYLESADSSASYCNTTTVQVYANATGFAGLFQGGQFNLTYDPNCANVTNVVFNPIWNDTFTTWWDTYTNGYTRVGFGADTPAEMVNGSVWICNLTIHCVCDSNCSTTLNFATTTKLVNDFGAEVKAHWLGGTFNGTAALPPPPAIFDTGPGTYPSIMGTHKGEIKPSCNISVSRLYTYPCAGTGGHTESIELYEHADLIANGMWSGYQGDYHNITITPSVTLLAGHTYNYTIVTGSYPQIHHTSELYTPNGTITCTQFVDANGEEYNDRIPAIRLE